MRWLWWAPFLAVLAHIFEEFVYPGGFADWDRSYRPEIRKSITPRLHLAVNLALVLACVNVGVAGADDGVVQLGAMRFRSMIPPRYAVATWLTLAALLFSNAVFHVTGTFQTGRMSPGIRTGLSLYVPLTLYGFWYFLSRGQTSITIAILAVLIGASYHFWSSMLHALRAKSL